METKKIWKSKTIWLGIIEIAIGILSYLQGELQSGVQLTAAGVLTVILRVVTNKAVSFNFPKL